MNYTSVKSENFAELHLWAFNKIKANWPTLSIYDKSNYVLNYVSSKSFHNEWALFIENNLNNLSQEDLASFLTVYEQK
jgi:hypothetical protein